MAQPNSGIGNVTTNNGLVEMAIAYSRSRVFARLHVSALPMHLETRYATQVS